MSRVISEDEREDYRRQTAEEEYERRYGPEPDTCPNCGHAEWEPVDYIYGDDADGHRGVRVKGHECQRCGVEVSA